jgi:serine/threonine protein kinase
MEGDRWKTVERLYHQAAERPHGEQAAFLESACLGDEDLLRDVESLLAAGADGFLEEPALDVAARDLAQDGASFVGRRLGSYEVLALLGAGGMGEVYRAQDTTLGREVALKLLPRELSSDPDRLSRLAREARLLASLNHPGIATLHGLEEVEGERFLIMELVPGQTLEERLRRGPLPIGEALSVGRQMAEALEAAHEKGVVHRDLKPANVKVTPDGRVKLLDFGLAKALEGTGAEAIPTPSGEATREGTVLGTPAYMSPEQARGQALDRRTDIWSFGCCLYESLSGQKAFGGATTSDTLAGILEREPAWSAMPDAIPDGVRRLLRRCLTKDVRKRLQHIGDARLDLEEVDARPDERAKRAPRRFHGSSALLGAALLGALLAGLGAWLAWRETRERLHQPVTRTAVILREQGRPDDLYITLSGPNFPLAISPDGRLIVCADVSSASSVVLRDLSDDSTRPLHAWGHNPFFSPDSRWIGFSDGARLWRVSVSGGPPIDIGPAAAFRGAVWGPGDEIVVSDNSSISSISVKTGQVEKIPVLDRAPAEEETVVAQAFLPGGSDLLVSSIKAGEAHLEALSRRTGRRRRLMRGGSSLMARYVRTGHIVYAEGRALFAVAVDDQFHPLGEAIPLIQGIQNNEGSYASVAVSDNGTVVYLPSERVREAELVWMDRAGNLARIPGDPGPIGQYPSRLSPNGRQAAVTVVEGRNKSVWIHDLERGTKRLLAEDSAGSVWSPDGAFVTYEYCGEHKGFYRRRADGTGEPARLFEFASNALPESWSPDGRSLLFIEYTSRGDLDIWTFSGGEPSLLLGSRYDEEDPSFSRDGRFIAYESDDVGRPNVYVQPFPGPGPRTQVSPDGGHLPRWGPNGRDLFYLHKDALMVTTLETGPTLQVGRPRVVLEQAYPATAEGPNVHSQFEVAPDGKRFLAVLPRRTAAPLEVRVVLNWFEELERLAPHPGR